MAGKTGRPCKLNKKVQDAICAAIRKGVSFEHAAIRAGISRSTFFSWRKQGAEADSGAFSDFLDATKAAEGSLMYECVGVLETAWKSGVWQAAAWMLERRWPQLFGRRVQEIQGKDGDAINIKLEWPGTNGNGNGE